MQRVQIQVEGIPLDTFESLDDEFYLTLQRFDLRNLQTREADYSRNISLPATGKNRTLLGLDTNERFNNLRIDCSLLIDQITIGFALLLITRYSEKKIEIVILDGGFELFDLLPDIGVSSLDLSAYNFPWTIPGLQAIAPNTTGVTLGLLEWYDLESLDDGVTNIMATTLRPIDNYGFCFYAKTLFREIIEQAGFTFTDLTGQDLYNNMFIACPVNVPAIQTGTHYAKVDRITSDFIYNAFDNIGLPAQIEFNNTVSDSAGLWSNYQYTIINSNLYNVRAVIDYSFTVGTNNSVMYIEIKNNGTVIAYYTRITDVTNDTQTIQIDLNLNAGDVIDCTVYANYQNGSNFDVVEIHTGSYFEVTEAPTAVSGDLVVSDWIPNINQKQFVADFLTFFNAVPVVNNFTKEVSIKLFNDIISDTAQDFSNNYDTSNDTFNEISLPYYRESLMSYSNDDISRQDADYVASFERDETLPKNGTIIRSLFSASDENIYASTVLDIPYFKTSYGATSGFSVAAASAAFSFAADADIKPGLWIYDGTNYYRIATVSTKRTGTLWITHPTGYSGDVQIVEFSKEGLTPRIGSFIAGTGTLSVGYNSFGPGFATNIVNVKGVTLTTWTELHNSYYKNLFDALQTPKILQVWMKFTSLEFYQIDMLRPVWIEGLNGYYYINRINQWKLNTLCQVELIRINRLI